MHMAVLSLCLELSEYRRDDGEAGRPSDVGNGPGMVPEVRLGYAARLRKKQVQFRTKWYLDEVFIKMNGVQHYGEPWTRTSGHRYMARDV